MKYSYIYLLISMLFMASCNTATSPLDKWGAGSSNDDVFVAMTADDMQQMKANNLDYLEVMWKYTRGNNDENIQSWAGAVRDRAREAGITIWSIHLPFGGMYDISQVNDTARLRAIEVNSRDMEAAARILSPKYFVIHPSAEPISDDERPARFEASRKSLLELARKARKLNVTLLIENLPRTCLGRTSTELLQLVDGIDNTAICFDTNHLLVEHQSDFIANCGDKIKSIHVSDYDRVNERHWLPGKGVIDWTELLDGLLNVGYKGPFIYEVSQTDPPLTIQKLGQNWKTLKTDYNISMKAKK